MYEKSPSIAIELIVGRFYLAKCKTLHIYLVVALLHLVIISSGCSGPSEEDVRLKQAEAALRNQLSAIESNDDSSPCRQIQIEHFKKALDKLGKLPNNKLTNPILVSAQITQHDGRWGLEACWIENNFDVNGFFLKDASGHVTDYFNVFPESEVLATIFRYTAWRRRGIPIITSDSDNTWKNHWDTKTNPPPIVLPVLDYAANGVRLGLLTKAGRIKGDIVVVFHREKSSEFKITPLQNPSTEEDSGS